MTLHKKAEEVAHSIPLWYQYGSEKKREDTYGKIAEALVAFAEARIIEHGVTRNQQDDIDIRNAALDEAAGIADACDYHATDRCACRKIAKAIRALKEAK